MNIPGAAIQHCIITRTCQDNRGVDGAFEEAVKRLRTAYEQQMERRVTPDMQFHLALIVQEDRHLQQ